MIEITLIMIASGLLSGILAGMFGVGGGIIIVPAISTALTWLSVDQTIIMHMAIATSLLIIIFTSISSAISHYKKNAVKLSIIKIWALPIIIGASIGAFITTKFSSDSLKIIFAFVILIISSRLFYTNKSIGHKTTGLQKYIELPTVFMIGNLSALIGIGGGSFSVPILNKFYCSLREAVGTSSLLGTFISIPSSILMIISGINDGRIPEYSLGYVYLPGLLFIAPCSILTAPLGAKIAHSIEPVYLKIFFACFLLLAAIKMLI